MERHVIAFYTAKIANTMVTNVAEWDLPQDILMRNAKQQDRPTLMVSKGQIDGVEWKATA